MMVGTFVLSDRPWLDRIFLVLVVAVPLLSFFAPLGLAPLLLITAVLALVFGNWRLILAAVPRGTAVLAGAFLLWGLVSAIWAIQPTISIYKFAQLFFLFAAGLIVIGVVRGGIRPETRTQAALAFAWSAVAVLGLLLIDASFEAPIALFLTGDDTPGLNWRMARHNRVATMMAIFSIPAAAAIGARYGWKAGSGMAVAVPAVLSLMHSRTAIVAAVVATLVALLAQRWRATMQVVVAMILVASLFLAPRLPMLIPADAAQTAAVRQEAIRHNIFSLFHRLRIWEFVVERIDERPVLGWGLDSSRSLPGGKEPTDASGERLSLHPHNAALQVRVELGIPGLILAAAFVLWPVLLVRRYTEASAAIVLAVTTAAAIVASMSYGIWQSWWVAGLWLAATLVALSCPRISSKT